MADPGRDLDAFMRVGMDVVIQLDLSQKWGSRFKTAVCGWRKPVDILVNRPMSGERLVPLRDGQRTVIRFVCDGYALAFSTKIDNFDKIGDNPCCRVGWPREFAMVSFRQFERIKVAIPCEIAVGEESFQGEIRDISVGGCGVHSACYIPEGKTIQLAFEMPHGVALDHVGAVVCNARRLENGGAFAGCELEKGQANVESEIATLIRTAALDQPNRGTSPDQRVLIIDANEGNASALRSSFEERGWYAFTAPATIDGLWQLRTLQPGLLIVNQDQQDLPGLDVARLVKSTKGLESLPVLVYGSEGAGLDKKATDVGARGYFGQPFVPSQICDAAAACIAGDAKPEGDPNGGDGGQ